MVSSSGQARRGCAVGDTSSEKAALISLLTPKVTVYSKGHNKVTMYNLGHSNLYQVTACIMEYNNKVTVYTMRHKVTVYTTGHNKVTVYTTGHNKVTVYTMGHIKVTVYTTGHNKVTVYTTGHNKVTVYNLGYNTSVRHGTKEEERENQDSMADEKCSSVSEGRDSPGMRHKTSSPREIITRCINLSASAR